MRLTALHNGCISEKHGVEYKYSCVLIELPSKVASDVIKWGKDNIDDSLIYTDPDDSSLGREDHIHTTVKYGLHDSDPDCIADLISDFGEFELELGKISKFESDDYDVIKLDVKSNKLHELNKLISSNVEVTDTHPTYIPHVTVAYVKKDSCDDLLGNDFFDGITVGCDEVQFSSKDSDGKTMLPLNRDDRN